MRKRIYKRKAADRKAYHEAKVGYQVLLCVLRNPGIMLHELVDLLPETPYSHLELAVKRAVVDESLRYEQKQKGILGSYYLTTYGREALRRIEHSQDYNHGIREDDQFKFMRKLLKLERTQKSKLLQHYIGTDWSTGKHYYSKTLTSY